MTDKELFVKVRSKVDEHLGDEIINYGVLTNKVFGIEEDIARELVYAFITSELCAGKIMLRKDISDGAGEHKRY